MTYEKPLPPLPKPYERFDACDLLTALYPDYQRQTHASKKAGGVVRLDAATRWNTEGRELLAVTFYVGEDAQSHFVCGQCRVRARVAVFEERQGAVVLVGGPLLLWHPSDRIEALFDGQAAFAAEHVAFSDQANLLALHVRWSTGMPGSWTLMNLFRATATAVHSVFTEQIEWRANGMGVADAEVVTSTVTPVARATLPNDLLVQTITKRCNQNSDVETCGPQNSLGTASWRFDGKAYRRVKGDAPPLPSLLRDIWGN